MNKGNIVITSSIAIGIVMTMIGGWFTQSHVVDAKIDEIDSKIYTINTAQDKQIAAVVEAVATLKSDNVEMKKDLKEILRAVK